MVDDVGSNLVRCKRCSGTYAGSIKSCPACRAPQAEFGQYLSESPEGGVSFEDVKDILDSSVTTLSFLPGHRILSSHGLVHTALINSQIRNMPIDGRITQAFEESLPRLLAAARAKGANAVIDIQLATDAIAGMSEASFGILMGSAVTVVPESPDGV
jgi:uncharacterized protein YbjQ (UPF0145 family)